MNWYGFIVVYDEIRYLHVEKWTLENWEANKRIPGYDGCTHPYSAVDRAEAIEKAEEIMQKWQIKWHRHGVNI